MPLKKGRIALKKKKREQWKVRRGLYIRGKKKGEGQAVWEKRVDGFVRLEKG